MSFSIKLNWFNPNKGTTTRIYRSTSAIDRNNLGTPYKVLSNDETGFEDTDVVYGTEYHYVFESLRGQDRAVSRNYRFSSLPYSGPGPQSFILGDPEYGYYGQVSPSEFISDVRLIAELGITEGATSTADLMWHKYSYKGKILYVPSKAILKDVSFRSLYNAGAIYGTDGSGGVTTNPVPQNASVMVGQESFKVRMPTLFSPDESENGILKRDHSRTELDLPAFKYSEFDLLLMPLTGLGFANLDIPRVSILDATDMTSAERYVLGQERVSETVVGYRNVTRSQTTMGRYGTTSTTQTTNGNWYPVLELIR